DRLRFRDEASGALHESALTPTIAADGAGSVVRASLAAAGHVSVREEWLDHDYKELSVPPAAARQALERHALHIWPRGGFMLIALPNTDGSFTATLFLARRGAVSFAALATPPAVAQFFASQFADVVPLMPELLAEFASHPQGQLGTVHVSAWQVAGRVRSVRARAPPERRGHCAHGAGELHRDARCGAGRTLRAPPGPRPGAGAALSRSLHPALFNGDVSPRDSVRRGAASRGG